MSIRAAVTGGVAALVAAGLVGCAGADPRVSTGVAGQQQIPPGAVFAVGYSTMNYESADGRGGPGGLVFINADGTVVDVPTDGLEAVQIAGQDGTVFYRDRQRDYTASATPVSREREYEASSGGYALTREPGVAWAGGPMFLDNFGTGRDGRPEYVYDVTWWDGDVVHTGSIPNFLLGAVGCGPDVYAIAETTWGGDDYSLLRLDTSGADLTPVTVARWSWTEQMATQGPAVCVGDTFYTVASFGADFSNPDLIELLGVNLASGEVTRQPVTFSGNPPPEVANHFVLDGGMAGASVGGKMVWVAEGGSLVSLDPQTGVAEVVAQLPVTPDNQAIIRLQYFGDKVAVIDSPATGTVASVFSTTDGTQLMTMDVPALDTVLASHGASVPSVVYLGDLASPTPQ